MLKIEVKTDDDESVQRLSNFLLNRWKKQYENARSKYSKAEEVKKGEKAKFTVELTEYDLGNPTRNVVLKRFIDTFAKQCGDKAADRKDEILDISKNIEKALIDNDKDLKKYSDKARTLLYNTKDDRNIELKRQLMTGAVLPEDFVKMNSH